MKNAARIAAIALAWMMIPYPTNSIDATVIINNKLRGSSVTEELPVLPHVVVLPSALKYQHQQHRNLQTTTRTVLILRIISPSLGEPSVSASQLYESVFSGNASLKYQLAKCSAGLLQLNPTAYGVLNVEVANANQNTAFADLVAMSQQSALGYVSSGYTDIRQAADHVMLVLPHISNFVANADIVPLGSQQHAISTYNDQVAAALSVLEHEIAHNLGLVHAWYNGNEYGDISGSMGMSSAQLGAPLSCYNAANHWKLNWYSDSRLDLTNIPSTPITVTVPAFVDYQAVRSDSSKPVLVKVGNDLFFQYNRAKDYNSGTRAFPDKLVLVQNLSTSTNLIAGLDASNPKYSDSSVHIEFCGSSSAGSYDFMIVSIGMSGTDCSAQSASLPSSSSSSSSSLSSSSSSSSSSTNKGSTWWSSWFTS